MAGQLLSGIELTGQPQRPAVEHDQPRRADQQTVGQVHFPAQQHADVLLGEQLFFGKVLYQICRDIEMPGTQRLLHRFVEQALRIEPAAGAQMQGGVGHHRLGDRPAAQQVREQMVIAVPVTVLVQRHQKHLMGEEKAQDLGAVMGFADGVAELAAKAFLRSGFVEKRLHFGRQAIDDFFEQIIAYQPFAAVQCLRQRGIVARLGHRQQPEAQTGDPAFAALDQAFQCFAAQ